MKTTMDPDTPPGPGSPAGVHAQCVDALPALLNGSLADDDAARVVAHIDECADCRAELDLARRVRAHVGREWRDVAALLEPQHQRAEFERLWVRIAPTEPVRPSPPRPTRRWVVSLTALAVAMLLGVGVGWYWNASAPDYTTLGDTPRHACGSVRVQVANPNAASRAALEGTGARIVDGPDSDGIFTLATQDPAAVIGALRALPEVRLAEPTSC
jgi:anti-sigma factor RsiW